MCEEPFTPCCEKYDDQDVASPDPGVVLDGICDVIDVALNNEAHGVEEDPDVIGMRAQEGGNDDCSPFGSVGSVVDHQGVDVPVHDLVPIKTCCT